MIRQGEDFFQPRNLEQLEELLDELPELAAGERYGGPSTLNVEDGPSPGVNYEDVLESAGELDEDEYLDEDGIGQEQEGGDQGDWLQEEDEDVEQNEDGEEYELEQDEDQRLPELSAGEEFESPND